MNTQKNINKIEKKTEKYKEIDGQFYVRRPPDSLKSRKGKWNLNLEGITLTQPKQLIPAVVASTACHSVHSFQLRQGTSTSILLLNKALNLGRPS